MVISVLSSTLLPAFIGRNLLTTTGSSATSHQHLPWVSSCIDVSTILVDLMSGFLGYCTDPLLEMPSSSTILVWLSIGLCAILHAYPPKLPNQVRFRYVPLTSYGFLQTPPLARDALAIRIVFPSVGVTQLSFKLTGLLASPSKQKKSQSMWLAFFNQIKTWIRTLQWLQLNK